MSVLGAGLSGACADSPAVPKPRFRLWRTWLRRPRPVRNFAPRMAFHADQDRPDPEVAAHWGEHILIEDSLTVLHRDGTITALWHLVTQLHSAEALSQWDELQRFFDTGKEQFRHLQARLYLPDGSVRQAARRHYVTAAPDTRPNRRGRTVQLSFAPLRPGVILEYEEQYDVFRPDDLGPFMWNHFFLRTRAPAARRRFTAAVAEPFELSYRVHHCDHQPRVWRHKKYNVYTWELQGAEGVECDDWTPPIRDFVPWIDVSTAPSWAPFARKLSAELEPGSAPTEVRELARQLSAGKANPQERAVAAYQYAAQHVRYGRPPTEALTRNIRASSQMFEDLRGDCKDKSALLVQLLRAMNLQANVAVVLTADGGRAPYLPSTRFNHALVKLTLDGRDVWLDAASGPFGFGELPPIDQDIDALVFQDNAFQFGHIPVSDGSVPTEHRVLTGRLALDGSYAVQARLQFRGEAAARLRLQLADRTAEHRHEVLQMWFGSDYDGAVASEFDHGPVNDLANGISYSCRATLERVARPVKNVLLLHVPWANPLAMAGPLSAAVRRQPLVLPVSHCVHEQHTIELPENAAVYAAPEPVSLDCEWGSYRCAIAAADGRLACEREFRLQGRMVPSADFPQFREFWRQVSWCDAAQVVLSMS